TARTESDAFGSRLYPEGDKEIVEAVGRVAERRGVPRAQIALAWVLRNAVITAPIVGATKSSHLTDAIDALDVQLDDAEAAELEQPYKPHESAGF
ncbi:aldo/keto reductase, partial [Sinomonas sp.]|uniref:aldo/keto reductase n=1 Tax=Sinomonas sp. TaxID=1914986 RepID=UPI003F7EE464